MKDEATFYTEDLKQNNLQKEFADSYLRRESLSKHGFVFCVTTYSAVSNCSACKLIYF